MRLQENSSERLYLTRKTAKCSAIMVLGQCSFVLLVNVDWKESKAFGIGDCSAMEKCSKERN